MTPFGRAHCIRRLNEVAHDAALLKARWEGFGVFAQSDPEVKAHYYRCQKGGK